MRSSEGVYLVDGPVLLAEAIDAGVEIDTVYVEPAALDHDVVWTARDAGLRVKDITEGALAKVLDLDTPQLMVAVATQRTSSVDELVDASIAAGRPLLVLDAVSDPGNVGTLVRVAEAAGCAGVLLGPQTADVFNPKTVRATAGAIFRVPVAASGDVVMLLRALRSAGVRSVATTGGEDVPAPESVDLTGAVAVVIGNEAHGLGADVVDACGAAVRIPMEGRVESLNAAVAGAAVLFDAARQRRGGEQVVGAVGPAEVAPVGGPIAEPNGEPDPAVGHNVDPGDARRTGESGDG